MKYTITLFTFFVTMTSLNARGLSVARMMTETKVATQSPKNDVIVNETPDERSNKVAQKSQVTNDQESQSSPSEHTVQPQENNLKNGSEVHVETKKVELDAVSQKDEVSNQVRDTEELDAEHVSNNSSQSSNSDVIEETVIETQSKVLNKEGKTEDSRSNGVKMAGLVSVITLIALIK